MVGVLDHRGLVNLFGQLCGRRFLGVVDCGDCVELVFDDALPGGNLVTIFTDSGRDTGLVALGGVAKPEAYIAGWQEWLEEAV